MEWFISDPKRWAMTHFGAANLGDKRRTDRLVKLAEKAAVDPAASIPKQTETWADTKAAYRLFDQEDVTFEAVAQPHWDLRQQCGPGRFAIISDTTDLDFGKNRKLTGVGPTGNGSGKGFLLHSGLLIDLATKHLLCLAGAELLRREPKEPKKKKKKKKKARRESERWGDLIKRIGRPPTGAQWIHVMDREADNFEVFYACREQNVDWLVRAKTLTRLVAEQADATEQERLPLREFLEKLPLRGEQILEVPAKAKTKREKARTARTATLQLRSGVVHLPPPLTSRSALVRELPPTPIPMGVVWALEMNPPQGEEAIEWILYTSLAVLTLDDLLEALAIYRLRWLIEEWHKALKTGTQIKERQLQTGDRLAPLIALSSIEAVRLVQLKTMARQDPERPAKEVVPARYLAMLIHALRMPKEKTLTVREFFRGVARLGGFLARKGDGEPGWQTTWRGWEKLVLMIRGQEFHDEANQSQKCG
jgi:transposase-like protein/transposase Tn5 family protein/DDE family transposase